MLVLVLVLMVVLVLVLVVFADWSPSDRHSLAVLLRLIG